MSDCLCACSSAVYGFVVADLVLMCACICFTIHNERRRCAIFAEFLREKEAALQEEEEEDDSD